MPTKHSDPDAYLATLAADKRATLEKVRKAIRTAAPLAEEGMRYGMPAFIQGKPIAGYAASAHHCSYYPMSGAITEALTADLEGYDTSKGAIRFPIGKPLPATLIRKLVKARLAEIAADTKKSASRPMAGKTDPAVAVFLRGLDHPLKKELEVARRIVLGVAPEIREGLKWNAPSFRTAKEFFATFNLRAKDSVQVILHRGAKVRTDPKIPKLADPTGLVKWLGKDRIMVTLGAGRRVSANRAAFEAILRAWIKFV